MVNTRNREPSEHVATKIGGRVCVDFMEGIGNPDANGGVKSMLIGVDENTDQTGVIAVKNSSQPHMLLEKLLEEMFRGEVRVKRLRLDNQFNTTGVQNWADEKEIILEFIVPYKHHQNGIPERRIRTLSDISHALLDTCDGKINLLPYAIVHAADVLNLWPTEENDEGQKICPLEKAQKRKQNRQDMPVFGCLAVVPVPPDQISAHTSPNARMRDRGAETIYLGRGSPFGKSGVLVWVG